MEPALRRDRAQEGREEIQDLVANNHLDRAIKRGLDYSREFAAGRDLENQVIILSGRFNRIRVDLRNFGSTADADAKYAGLMNSLLGIVDQIYEQYSATPIPRATFARSNDQAAANDDALEPRDASSLESYYIGPEPEVGNLTSLEAARQRFMQRRKKAPEEAVTRPDAVFRCKGLSKSYGKRSGFRLEGIDLDLRLGEITGVVGMNASGKTTLLRVIAGDLAATVGSLSYPSLSPDQLKPSLDRNLRRLPGPL
jgi:ABC-type multidrug transport system fused ATPase/permease subunit